MSVTEDKRKQLEQKKKLYLQRVNQLFTDIQAWLQDEKLIAVLTELEIVDTLGNYNVTLLTIKTPTGKKLVDFRPRGVLAILAEGLIYIEGWLGIEYLAYMVDGGSYFFKTEINEKKEWIKTPYYSTVSVDGWYWIDGTQKDSAHKMDKALLLKLIFHVSE